MIYDVKNKAYRLIVLTNGQDKELMDFLTRHPNIAVQLTNDTEDDPYTSDTIYLNDTYSLDFVIPNSDTRASFSATGVEAVGRCNDLLFRNTRNERLTLAKMNDSLCPVIMAWGLRELKSPDFDILMSAVSPQFKSWIQDILADNESLRNALCAYLYLQLCVRNLEDKVGHKVIVERRPPTSTSMNAWETGWDNQPDGMRRSDGEKKEYRQVFRNSGLLAVSFPHDEKFAA
jgi:hypothetical protein